MNFIAIIILTTIFVDFILNFYSDILNLKAVKDELPDEFKDIYEPEKYQKSQQYLKVSTQFGWYVAIFDLFLIIAFWFGKGFPSLDYWIRSWNLNIIVTGVLYMAILGLLKTIISLPFGIYSTFVIEERFGFNKTTWKTFVLDLIKGFFLSIIIGVPLLAGILAFFEYAGSNAWWYCWIVVTIFMFIIQFIAPTWIMPLFNKFEPLEEGELREAIMSYAESVNFPLKNLFVMDGSKRSSKSNAFFTGFGKNKRIALYDTLIEKHTKEELVAILAHEIGHYKKKHVFINILIGILHSGLMFYLLSFFISYEGLFDAFYMENISVYSGLIFFGMLLSPIDFFLGLAMQVLSRKNEYEADKFAVETTKNSGPMIDALKKLSMNNLSNLSPHPFYVFLNYSHPPVMERIKAIRTL